jgi:hypothetical protein
VISLCASGNQEICVRSKYSWVVWWTKRTMLLCSSTVTKPAHTETMSSISGRFSLSSSDAPISTPRACRSSDMVNRLLAQVIQDRTCLASSLESAIWPSILSIASLYAWSYASDPVESVSNAVLMALGDLFPISEPR